MKFLVLFALVAMAASASRHPLLPRPQARHSVENRTSNSYIVGGVAATAGQVPYIVSIQRTSHTCGGAIFNAVTIITAAHCVYGVDASALRIRYNTLNHGSGGSLVNVLRVFTHENYNANTMENDIALLTLSSFLTLGQVNADQVKQPGFLSDPEGNVRVSGWGTTSEGGSISAALRYVEVPVVDRATCNTIYGGKISDNMFCAGVLNVGGQDACQGDSGGPAVITNQLVGIASWGNGCARPGYPGVYTRVSNYILWILSNM